jgi:hypothetical protein
MFVPLIEAILAFSEDFSSVPKNLDTSLSESMADQIGQMRTPGLSLAK